MPLTIPPQIRMIYAECNTPAANVGKLAWDTFYDESQNVISGAPLTAALAALGLTYAAGTFASAGVPVVLSVDLGLNVTASPGGADSVTLNQPGYDISPTLLIPSTNALGYIVLHKTFVLYTSESFWSAKIVTNPTDTPLVYASMNIIRLV